MNTSKRVFLVCTPEEHSAAQCAVEDPYVEDTRTLVISVFDIATCICGDDTFRYIYPALEMVGVLTSLVHLTSVLVDLGTSNTLLEDDDEL